MIETTRGSKHPTAAPYVAKFLMHSDAIFRLDTRIYLADCVGPRKDDACIAAIVAKNPGAALPKIYDSLSGFDQGKGQLLTTVRNRFEDAFERARKDVPERAFVRVWNLFYLREPDFHAAIKRFKSIRKPPKCRTEDTVPPIVWFAWGGPHRDLLIEELKGRFRAKRIAHPFFYDRQKIVCAVPQPGEFARHTQGLRAEPIVEFLSKLL